MLRFKPTLRLLFSATRNINMARSNNDTFKIEQVFNVAGKVNSKGNSLSQSRRLIMTQVALVTGGGSGIGLMATQALAVNGAKVYIVGRTEQKLERVVETHGQNIAGQIIPLTADIRHKSEIARLVKEVESREKCLCILINNASISGSTQQVESMTAEEMKQNLFDAEASTVGDWINTY
jgi:NADP-dependent 3-hydroxy acid dehydrogenase YdfG